MSGYSRALERLHGQIVARLADATAQHFDQQGQARGEPVPVIYDRQAERTSFNGVDYWQTLAVQLKNLPDFDRKGYFLVDGVAQALHIDDIASNDGHMITFYVRG